MFSSLVKKLEENEVEIYFHVTNTILQILRNVLSWPENRYFRTLNYSDPTVRDLLIPAIGAEECLLAVGFKKGDSAFELPLSSGISNFISLRDEILKSRENYVIPKYAPLMGQLVTLSRYIRRYEDQRLQEMARKLVPPEALNCMQTEGIASRDPEFSRLYGLMVWFKVDFFKWTDKPKCEKCVDDETTLVAQRLSTNNDRIEIYTCNFCKKEYTFRRYNNPEKLLETRQGRCGEWANCFGLFCRAFGMDTRYVLDKTDHVWIEVYSHSEGRWVHCDPCEMALDKPLMYELGWNKRLTYVLAVSAEEVQDVTWRYTCKFAATMARRKLCDEVDLLVTILRLTAKLQENLSESRREFLTRRRAIECASFLTEPKPNGSYECRTTGAIEWRRKRGEGYSKAIDNDFKFRPNEQEKKVGRLTIRYSCTLDKYYRIESNEYIPSWQNGVFIADGIRRKVEYDWKMCYLARQDGAEHAAISWKFVTDEKSVTFDKITVRYSSTIFEDGHISWVLCDTETCLYMCPEDGFFETDKFKGSSEVSVTASLDGGDWQHTQLFRQPLDNKDYPFEVSVSLTTNSKCSGRT